MTPYKEKFYCCFCQFRWSTNYFRYGKLDPHPVNTERRPEPEARGEVCPRCGVFQSPTDKNEVWRTHVRKFLYGRIDPHKREEIENWIGENFTYDCTDQFAAVIPKKI